MHRFSESDTLKGFQKTEVLNDEFKTKMSYDFDRYVFLGLRSGASKVLQEVTHQAISQPGYEAHRFIQFKGTTIHMYIRFKNKWNAYMAVKYFKNDPAFIAENVSEMLGSLYAIEMTFRRFPSWTYAIVDVSGKVEHTNPLAKDVVASLLLKFGDPRINHCRMGVNGKVDYVQVQFSTMAEALGANIARGCWRRRSELESKSFHYRVRIVAAEKEFEILKFCGSVPGGDNSDAFGIEYFCNVSNSQWLDSKNFNFRMPNGAKTDGEFYKINSEEATYRRLCNFKPLKGESLGNRGER